MTTSRTHRSAEEIGRTLTGPRPLPELAAQGVAVEPNMVDTVLANGLRVLAVRHARVPLVELRLRIPFAGSDALHCATAELLAETLLAGTQTRDRIAMDTDLALIGGELSTGVDPERLAISGSALSEGLPRLLEVLADSLTAAAYHPEEIERERARLIERLAVARSQPGVLAREALQKHRYGDHPAAREVPEVADVAAVPSPAVAALHAGHVVPRGAVLVLVGDIDPESALTTVESALRSWHSDTATHRLPALPKVSGGDLALVHRAGAVQSALRLTAQAVPRTDERYPALQLANLAYGGFFSSRLVENIREDKGYTYHARSSLELREDAGTVLVDTDTASEVTAAALLEIRYECKRMAVLPPTQSEVDTVRRYVIGSLLTSTATQSGYASQLAGLAEVGLGADWLREHPVRLESVSVEQVAAAAAEFFDPAAFTGIVLGDRELIGPSLRALGGVAAQ
ncbi:MAG: M16 family metallopeptidase [Sciscionella sp.]